MLQSDAGLLLHLGGQQRSRRHGGPVSCQLGQQHRDVQRGECRYHFITHCTTVVTNVIVSATNDATTMAAGSGCSLATARNSRKAKYGATNLRIQWDRPTRNTTTQV